VLVDGEGEGAGALGRRHGGAANGILVTSLQGLPLGSETLQNIASPVCACGREQGIREPAGGKAGRRGGPGRGRADRRGGPGGRARWASAGVRVASGEGARPAPPRSPGGRARWPSEGGGRLTSRAGAGSSAAARRGPSSWGRAGRGTSWRAAGVRPGSALRP